MPEVAHGLVNQIVRNELLDASRRLQNIGTLSGTLPALSRFTDRSTPVGHLIPGLIQRLWLAISNLDRDGDSTITFEQLSAINREMYDACVEHILATRRIEFAVNMERAPGAITRHGTGRS